MHKQVVAMMGVMICASAQASPGSWIEPNVGQTDPAVKAIARDGDLTLLLEPQRARVLLPRSETVAAGDDGQTIEKQSSVLLELVLHGADSGADAIMGQPRGAVSRYFRGNNPEAWIDNVNHHDSLRFVDVYPGIDLVYKLREGRIEYDFEVQAGADSSQISLGLLGTNDLSLDADGNLIGRTGAGEFRQRAPEVFRITAGGRQTVAGAFQLDGNTFGFEVDSGAAGDALIIDPVIELSGYLGGSGNDQGSDIAFNSRGNLVISGTAISLDIPGASPGYTLGGQDLFFAEIERETGQLLWISFVGGAGYDWADAMAVDSQDNIVAAGFTESADFPVLNAFQSTFVGSDNPSAAFYNWDGIVLKLSDDGSQVIFATYYGGLDWNDDTGSGDLGFEWFRGVDIDSNDHIFVGGQTAAPDFPVTTLFRGVGCMENDAGNFFVSDMTVVEFAPDGTRLFATCIGGSNRDAGRDVAVGPDGRIFVGGFGRSSDFPTSPDAFRPGSPGNYSALIAKLDEARTDIDWATYVGGSAPELLQEFAVDSDGAVVASGTTNSIDFPVTANALQPALNAGFGQEGGYSDAFVVKLSNDGTTLEYGTYFGGVKQDSGYASQVDAAGRIYFAGSTGSRNLIERTSLQPGPRPLFGSHLSLDNGAAVNAIANLSLPVPGFFLQPVAVAARDGINTYHVQVAGDAYLSYDIGVESENSVDAVVGDFGPSGQFDSIFFVNSFAANPVYLYSGIDYVLDRQVGSADSDSRAGARLFDGVVVANFGQQNEIFLDADDPPLLIGRPDGDTVDVVTGSFGGETNDVIFANRGQEISLYRSLSFPNFDSAVIISTQSPNVSALTAGDINGDFETDLVIGNNPGPIQFIIFSAGVPGPVQEIPASAAATNTVFLFDIDDDGDQDLFAGNDGPDSFYYNDGTGGFSAASELPSFDTPTSALTVGCVESPNFVCEPWLGSGDGVGRYKLSAVDVFIAVIDPDTGTLEFSSYLDSGASDFLFRGLTLGDGGSILGIGYGRGDAWPAPGGAEVAANLDSDAVFIEIDIDIDDDGVLDGSDNCLEVANPLQRDTDNDAYGNFCDPDLNNDGAVNFADLQLLKQRFFGTDPDADLDGDGSVNFADLQIARSFIFGSPGPSGLLLP